MFDHLRIWTTWKQCEEEYRKALVADAKDLEMLGKQTKNFLLCLRDAKVVGSNPVASTKKCRKLLKFPAFFICFFNFPFFVYCVANFEVLNHNSISYAPDFKICSPSGSTALTVAFAGTVME